MIDILKLIPPERSEDYAYKMGFDSSINGANTINCHFSIFSSPENMEAWEDGVKDGKDNQRLNIDGAKERATS